MAVWSIILGFVAIMLVFRTTDWRGLIRAAESERDTDAAEGQVGSRDLRGASP